LTEALRRSNEIMVIGITEEQHPDRCRLWAQWQGIEWPILWDPFNLTGSSAVPVVMAADEHGVVQFTRLDPRRFDEQFGDEFLAVEFPKPKEQPADPHPGVREENCGPAQLAGDDMILTPEHAMARFLWYEKVHGVPMPARELDHAVRSMGLGLDGPADHFRLGVAHRLRYDSPDHRPEDFQSSIDHWMTALLANPSQYIWRRRIQQWGPRLDKPYPFYDWVAKAQAEVSARGEEPVAIRVPLTGSEVAAGTREIPKLEGEAKHPDPEQKLPRDSADLVSVETAAALHTGVAGPRSREPVGTARVHVVLRPDPERRVHWTNDAGPTLVWISVPEGWNIKQNLFTLELPEVASTEEVRRLDFEVRPPTGDPGAPAKPASLKGVAFYYVCEGESGECTYLARDFEVQIPIPKGR
jgi:hypothetical protein